MNAELVNMALCVLETAQNLERKAKCAERDGFTERMEVVAQLRGEARRLSDKAHAT